MSPSASERYTRTAIALHWLIAALVIFQFALGWWMQEIPKQPVGPRVNAFNLHKSIGLTILALMVVRLLWRAGHRPPPLPPMPRWQARAAIANHVLLYVLLIVHPLVGYLGSEFSGYPVKLYGVTLPRWAGRHDAAKDALSALHLVTSWLILLGAVLHVGAALRHAFVDRDGLLSRMGIGRGQRPTMIPPARHA